jgi:biopolymer transport protein ExbD
MVDVTFLLLIFFLVTAAFTLQKSLDVPPLQEKGGVVEPQSSAGKVIVEIDRFNTYHVSTEDWEREAPSEHELLAALRDARAGGTDGSIPTRLFVKAHGNSLHEKVVAALDSGAVVGMEEVLLATIDE